METVKKNTKRNNLSLDRLRSLGTPKDRDYHNAWNQRNQQERAEAKVHVQPDPIVFEGPVNAWYKTTRNGVTTQVFLIEVRKDKVLYKDKVEDKHAQSLSLAKFVRFYVPA